MNSGGDKNSLYDKSENHGAKKQINAILQQTIGVNSIPISNADTDNWYCNLRMQDHDHEYDGIR